MEVFISIQNVSDANLRLVLQKTYRFMMSNAVAQYVDAVEFVEHVGIIILH